MTVLSSVYFSTSSSLHGFDDLKTFQARTAVIVFKVGTSLLGPWYRVAAGAVKQKLSFPALQEDPSSELLHPSSRCWLLPLKRRSHRPKRSQAVSKVCLPLGGSC